MADDFAAMMESTGPSGGSNKARPQVGDSVEGRVIQMSRDSVFLDIGANVDARIDRFELEDGDGNLKVVTGDRITARVVADEEVMIVLSTAVGRGQVDATSLQRALESGVPIEGSIAKAVSAGLEVMIGKVRGFCPASHVALERVNDLSIWVGENAMFRVLEVKDNGRSVIVSRRAILEEEQKEKQEELLNGLVIGADVEGTVHSIQSFGAFIDIGGALGMIHISELSRGRVERVDDVLQIGDTVTARVLNLEAQQKGLKISLSLKALEAGGEASAPAPVQDEVLTGKVVKHIGGGLFVSTVKGDGFVPNRELTLPHGADARRTFPEGKEIEVAVLRRDNRSGKTTFSMRAVSSVEERKNFAEFAKKTGKSKKKSKSGFGSLGDVMRAKLGLPEPPPEPDEPAEVPAPPPVKRVQSTESFADIAGPKAAKVVAAKARPIARDPEVEVVVPKGPPPAGVVRGRRRAKPTEPEPDKG